MKTRENQGATPIDDWIVRHKRFGDTERHFGEFEDFEPNSEALRQVLEDASISSMFTEVVKLRL